MAKIYDPPEDIGPVPGFKGAMEWNDYETLCENYLSKVCDWCAQHGKGKYRGKLVKESVADGYAMYVVFSTSPVQLIHVPLYDAWEFRWAHRWTAADIKEMVEREEKIKQLFQKQKGA